MNNRNLKDFTVDLAVTESLASQMDLQQTLLVSESGIDSRTDVKRLTDCGARAILVILCHARRTMRPGIVERRPVRASVVHVCTGSSWTFVVSHGDESSARTLRHDAQQRGGENDQT